MNGTGASNAHGRVSSSTKSIAVPIWWKFEKRETGSTVHEVLKHNMTLQSALHAEVKRNCPTFWIPKCQHMSWCISLAKSEETSLQYIQNLVTSSDTCCQDVKGIHTCWYTRNIRAKISSSEVWALGFCGGSRPALPQQKAAHGFVVHRNFAFKRAMVE